MTTPSRRPSSLNLILISGQVPEQSGEVAVRGEAGYEVGIYGIRKGGSDGPRQVRVGAR